MSLQSSSSTSTTDAANRGNPWTSPSNANASDGAYASIGSLASLQTSNTLAATCTGFSLPSTATIVGIAVGVTRKETFMGGNACDASVTISVPTVALSFPSDYAVGSAWPTSVGTAAYGGATDLWGASRAPTYSEINSNGVAVAFSAKTLDGTSSNPQVDYISVDIYYTTSGGGDPFPAGYQCQTRTNTLLRM